MMVSRECNLAEVSNLRKVIVPDRREVKGY